MTIGQKLKRLRTDKGSTQLQVAKYVGVNFQTIYKYEKDIVVPPSETLLKLSEYFNVSIDFLLGNTKEDKYSKYKHLNNSLIGRVSNKMEGMSEDELDLLDKLIDKIIKDDK